VEISPACFPDFQGNPHQPVIKPRVWHASCVYRRRTTQFLIDSPTAGAWFFVGWGYVAFEAEDNVPSEIQPGVVYLVGAGPGSADLITVRGLRLLRSADVVLHDSLISPDLLIEARPDAEVVSVGKRGYCIGSTKQETINEAMVRLAREGQTVCRLKCGDPCVFGRGGEEAAVLAEAGIPFQIVPGVTSAMAACASANIPLTHRAVGPSVTLITGHHDPDSPECTLDWGTLARLPVVVFYMASRYVSKIADRLSNHGMSSDTPVAVIESATLPHERIWIGSLATTGEEEFASPAILVVGEVVRYRDVLTGLVASHFGASA
jgi:uroporphyrin-III C-methyltransferase